MNPRFSASLAVIAAVALAHGPTAHAEKGSQPQVGAAAPDFELPAVAGGRSGQVKLSEVTAKSDVVLVMLRGWPGYQCPLCSRQVGDFVKSAKAFSDKGAEVLLVYPGPASQLSDKAKAFLRSSRLPKNFTMVTDPDYEMTQAYGLRWAATRETAYPATFVIGTDGKISWSKISKSHGGRTNAKEVLAQL
ncbi:MAG: peroxiredoxin family protein [Planctomycetota bacterium]